LKNQNDLIISVVSLVLAAIIITVFYFTKADPKMAPTAEVVNTGPLAMPAADVKMANALPGGSSQGSGGGGSDTATAGAGGGGGPRGAGAGVMGQ